MLNGSVRADIAVGYLFLSGIHAVAPQLERQEKIRLLVGRTDRPTLDAVAAGLQQAEALRGQAEPLVRRSQREELARTAANQIGEGVARLPQDNSSETDVRCLRDMIADGRLEIKTYPKGTLHAKAYLCWYGEHSPEPGAAIVGSSNFTLAGFTGNTELNVRITGDAEMAALAAWFDALWRDAVDITDDVLVELKRSWPIAQTPPYHVYLKALYELYRDELGMPRLEPTRSGAELASFQQDAVRHALGMIERHGGCFIGDVVGLGKSYIGAEIVRQLQYAEPAGSHPLIICPAGLIPLWERMSEMFGLGAKVISMSAIRPPAGLVFDEEADTYVEGEGEGPGIDLLQEYPDRGVVLVDEVHNFRNAGTRRYEALFQYLWNGDHKVVMLSATPQNLGPRDIYNQLRLFLDEVDHGLALEPVRLEDFFRNVQRWYEYEVVLSGWQLEYGRWEEDRRQGRIKATVAPPVRPPAPEVPRADITDVLLPVFIRRRRKDIKELYGEDATLHGKRVTFPAPSLDNLSYRLDKVYDTAFRFDELADLLARHTGARYRAADYLTDAARQKPDYRDLIRARSRVASLTQFLLVKRLESSVAAFRSTLEVLTRSNRNFRQALDQGFVPVGGTATAMLSGYSFDPDQLLARLEREQARRRARGESRDTLAHPTHDFDVARWVTDLDADYAVIEGLLERIRPITPDQDDKLQSLKTFLARPEVAAGKIIVFSEAEATIDYLYEQLNPDGKDPSIARISGSSHKQIQDVVKRFSPGSNLRPKERMPGPSIRVLLATDVVSEGQNLQDCNRVLNYDLHWNPVRLIQRFGRVDRIGSRHDRIYLHNTWPDTAVDAQLSLTDRLLHRIQAFHDMIGLDNPLLSDAERMNASAMFAIYEGKRLPDEEGDDLDVVSAHQRGINLLQQLERNNPDLWQLVTHLPDGIRSALTPPERALGADIVHFAAAVNEAAVQIPLDGPMPSVQLPLDAPRTDETLVLLECDGSRLAYAVGGDGPRLVTTAQLITAMTCTADTPTPRLPADTNQRVMAAYEAARAHLASRLGREARPRSNTQLHRYLARQLRILREQHRADPAELQRLEVLQRVFLDVVPPVVTDALDEARKLHLDGDSLVKRMEALRERYRLNPADEEEGTRGEVKVLRIVCSDGLV